MQMVTDSCMPLMGLQLDMRALSSPAELQAYEEWMTDATDILPSPEQPSDAEILTRSWWAL